MARIDLITLQQIRDVEPCKDGWNKLLTSLGGLKTPLTTVISIGDIAKSNGVQDALWCCRVIGDSRYVVSLVIPSVKRSSKYTKDNRVHGCITSLDKWLAGDDTVNLKAAADAAYAAAYDTTRAAHYAAVNAADSAYAAYTAAYAAAHADTRAVADAAIDAAFYAATAANSAAIDANVLAERKLQIGDIIKLSPLHALK